jgi:hypothetical protein
MSQGKLSISVNSNMMEKGLFYFSGICVVGFSATILAFSILKISPSSTMILGIIVGAMTILFGMYAGYMMASTRPSSLISSIPMDLVVGMFGVSMTLIILGVGIFGISIKKISYSVYFTSLYAFLTIIPIIIFITASRENSLVTIRTFMSLVMILTSSAISLGIVNLVENGFPTTGG